MSEQKYEFTLTGEARKADSGKMMDATINYYNMSYSDLVKVEQAALTGLIQLGNQEVAEREG